MKIKTIHRSPIFSLGILSFTMLGLMHTEAYDRRCSEVVRTRLQNSYKLEIPGEIKAGSTEAVNFVITPEITSSEFARLISEFKNHYHAHSHSNSHNHEITPCVISKLDLIDTDGLKVKAITESHQKLLPYSQNHWTWQLKGQKPGEYLLSLTVSLCTHEEGEGGATATPLAINRKITVLPTPGVSSGDESSRASILFISLFAIFAGGVAFALKKFKTIKTDRSVEVIPGNKDERLFVSYSKYDRKRIEPIIAELKKAGHQLWIDRHQIEGASSWREEIVKALTGSQGVVFFASENAYGSTNVGKELALAADENLTIIPVLLENCEAQGASRFVVAGLQRIDARNDSPKKIASEIAKVWRKSRGKKSLVHSHQKNGNAGAVAESNPLRG